MKRKTIKIEDPNSSSFGTLTLELEGTSPLIVHCFSKKAEILQGHIEGKKVAKPPKNPDRDFAEALYVFGEQPKGESDLNKKTRYGFPAVAFKSALVRAAKLADVSMTDSRSAIFVEPDEGELVEILTPEKPTMRIDQVRNATSVVDIRIRPQFTKWTVKLRILYNLRGVTAQQLVSWAISAGRCVGVGEWRPSGRSSSGIYGCWKVTKAEAMEPDMAGAA